MISSIRIARGQSSNFRMNVDGVKGKSLSNIEIPAKDSLFVFVAVTVDPNNLLTPFLLTDSIVFVTNGIVQDVNLIAYGQNAHFIKATKHQQWLPSYKIICKEKHDTTWTPELPIVIYGGYALIDSLCCLTIEAGTKIYSHNNSGLWVYQGGCLIVNGTKENPVIFQGDRLEAEYREKAGQWDRIWINEGSKNNVINYAIIKNGFIGIQAETVEKPLGNILVLTNTKIENMSGMGLFSRFYGIVGFNTLITNCGQYAAALTWGGAYQFIHCTFANYWNESTRKTPSLLLNNYAEGEDKIYDFSLSQADFQNCIIYGGNENELSLDSASTGKFIYNFQNCLLKSKGVGIVNGSAVDSAIYSMETIYKSNKDFHLNSSSPAIDKGNAELNKNYLFILNTDLDGKIRDGKPDLGVFEY